MRQPRNEIHFFSLNDSFQYATESYWKITFLQDKICNILLNREIKFRENFFPWKISSFKISYNYFTVIGAGSAIVFSQVIVKKHEHFKLGLATKLAYGAEAIIVISTILSIFNCCRQRKRGNHPAGGNEALVMTNH